MSAPGCSARRLWGDASEDAMPAASLRRHSPPINMARHRTLRRAMASASAKMPRSLCLLGYDRLELQRRRMRRHRLCRRQAAFEGASGAQHPQMICPQRRCANNRLLIIWRVTEPYGAKWHRSQRRCRGRRSLVNILRGSSSVPVHISDRDLPYI
jgi:hypothetical protein